MWKLPGTTRTLRSLTILCLVCQPLCMGSSEHVHHMPVTCESCQDKHGLYNLIPYCAWCDSHYITAHLGMFMPVTCESCQDKHGLHVLLPYCAWCASYCIRAELDTHMPVMCGNYQDKHGLPVLLPDCLAWFASYCNLYKGGTWHARTCYVWQLPAQTWTACSLTRLHGVPSIV